MRFLRVENACDLDAGLIVMFVRGKNTGRYAVVSLPEGHEHVRDRSRYHLTGIGPDGGNRWYGDREDGRLIATKLRVVASAALALYATRVVGRDDDPDGASVVFEAMFDERDSCAPPPISWASMSDSQLWTEDERA